VRTAPQRISTARAAVVAGPGRVRLERVAAPTPGPGEVLLRVEGCGLCGSDLPVWEGVEDLEYPLAPGAPGHEAWGRIEAVGEDVTGLAHGERVAALTYRSFAEYDVADAGSVLPLPRELDGEPFPGEAIGCAVNVFRRAGVRGGQTVAVVGIGFLGAVLVQLVAGTGARVLAFTRRELARDIARSFGAVEAHPLDAPVADESCDVVIEAAGAQQTLDLASRLTRTRGRLVIAGYHQGGPRLVDLRLWNWRGLDVVNAHERDPSTYVDGIRAGIREVVAGRLTPGPLYTHSFPLERIGDAFEAARARSDGFMKALVAA
jgi:threonine dehydrogenase-like Zn-dependent dehydrogenase